MNDFLVSLLHLTDLIKGGSVLVEVGKNSVRVERNLIQVDICDADSTLLPERGDILSQARQAALIFWKEGKTMEIKYHHSLVLKLGRGADSMVLKLAGMDHISFGNPFTLYHFLRKRKGQ